MICFVSTSLGSLVESVQVHTIVHPGPGINYLDSDRSVTNVYLLSMDIHLSSAMNRSTSQLNCRVKLPDVYGTIPPLTITMLVDGPALLGLVRSRSAPEIILIK